MATPKKRPPIHLVEDVVPTVEAPAPTSAVDRAEHFIDDWGSKLAGWSQKVAHSAARAGSRVREEVEDIFAEAKAISRSKR